MADSITSTDNRTGNSIEVPIVNGGVDANEWSKLLPGVWFYDPSFGATASTSSAITELDGGNGILRYRGHPIEQLAEHSTYLEVAYLPLHGDRPTPAQYEAWKCEITTTSMLGGSMPQRYNCGTTVGEVSTRIVSSRTKPFQ